MDTLTKIVRRLPFYLQGKWAEKSGKRWNLNSQLPILTLVRLVNLAGSKPESEVKEKSKLKFPVGKGSAYVVQAAASNAVPETQGQPPNQRKVPKSVFCLSETHEIAKCYAFRQKPYKDRIELRVRSCR